MHNLFTFILTEQIKMNLKKESNIGILQENHIYKSLQGTGSPHVINNIFYIMNGLHNSIIDGRKQENFLQFYLFIMTVR